MNRGPGSGRVLIVPCAVVLATIVGACVATSRSKAASSERHAATEELRGDHELESRLEVFDPSIRSAAGGRILSFELSNKSGNVERVLLAIEWLDRRGNRLAADRRLWTPLELQPGTAQRVELAVPVPEAESWRWHAVHPDHAR